MSETKTLDSRSIATVQYAAPTTGATVNMNDHGNVMLVLDPATTLVSLTVVLPPNPQNGDIAIIATSQILTTLTITGNIIGTLTTLALGGYAKFIYSSTASKWFRAG